jgi:hypothetical protein
MVTVAEEAAGAAETAIGVAPTAWHAMASGDAVLRELGSSMAGLSSEEAAKRLQQ